MSDLLPVLLSMHQLSIQLSIQPVARSEAPLSAKLVADLRWLRIEEFLNFLDLCPPVPMKMLCLNLM